MMNFLYRWNTLLSLICILSFAVKTFANNKTLLGDYRHRPPEMVIDEQGKMSGPLKVLIEEAVKTLGYSIKWREAPFPRSLEDLKLGKIDFLPRTIRNADREKVIDFVGPVGFQLKHIHFLVKKHREDSIKKYEDLYGKTIGVKRSAAYFDRFNKDKKLDKFSANDDDNMSQMFANNRFDTMAVLDKKSLEIALAKNNIKDFSFAKYRYEQKIGIFYGFPKSEKRKVLFQQLNTIFAEWVKNGKVKKVYETFGLGDVIQ